MAGSASGVLALLGGAPAGGAQDRDALSARLGLSVGEVYRIGDSYELHATDADGRPAKITLPDAAALANPRRVEEALLRDARHAVHLGVRRDWMPSAGIVARLAVEVEVPSEADECRAWVSRCLREQARAHIAGDGDLRHPANAATLAHVYAQERYRHLAAWREGRRAVVAIEALADWLGEIQRTRLTLRRLGERLRAAGFQCEHLSAAGHRRRLWTIDLRQLDDEPAPPAGSGSVAIGDLDDEGTDA